MTPLQPQSRRRLGHVAAVAASAASISRFSNSWTASPGTAVEIIALGSPDVRDVTLSDGIGRALPFVYDVGTKSWRAFYRVPMMVRGERLGLSVTARNDGNRWRRVWVFLRVQREGVPEVAAPVQP